MTYREVNDYIEGIVRFTKKHSNEHTRECLHLLGDPDRSFKIIHIAGTNGKGSVCAFLASVLNKGGFKTGRFISPHLIRLNERIAIDGGDISDEDFIRVFERVRDISVSMENAKKGHPSYFEFLFLMAMVYFADQKVDVAVIETGLGGRLDATNAVEHPILTVITSIGMDHTRYLGSTISEIASEKAGIMKAGTPCVFAADDKEAEEAIRRSAAALSVPLYALYQDDYRIVKTKQGEIDFLTCFRYDELRQYHTTMKGRYQAQNGALALLGLDVLKKQEKLFAERLTPEVMQGGIAAMTWQGRMEEISPHIFLDGAHNDNGIRRFIESVNAIAGQEPSGLLFAVVQDKDFSDMIRDLSTKAKWDFVLVSEAGGERKTDADEIAALFEQCGISRVTVIRDPKEAYYKACQMRKNDQNLFVCGSLYLIGKIKELTHDQL